MSSTKIHHVSIQGDTGDADSDTVDSEYARHAAAFAAARKRKASYHYQGKRLDPPSVPTAHEKVIKSPVKS